MCCLIYEQVTGERERERANVWVEVSYSQLSILTELLSRTSCGALEFETFFGIHNISIEHIIKLSLD